MQTESYSRHLRILLLAAGALLLALAGVNLLADPYLAFGLLSRTQFSHSAAGLHTRTGKGEMIAHHDWDVLLAGTSRVEAGLDPGHRAFAGLRAYNAGLPGAGFSELEFIVQLAMQRPSLKRVIFCVDRFSFDSLPDEDYDRSHSLLNPNINSAQYYLDNLLSLRTTQLSIDTIVAGMHHGEARDYPSGLFAPHRIPGPHRRADWHLGGYLNLTLPKGVSESGSGTLDAATLDAMASLLADASRHGVRVDLVGLPVHALCMEGYAAMNLWPAHEQWVRTLARIVDEHNRRFPDVPARFWDFATYNAITTDPAFNESAWFYDPFHIKVPLGDLVLDCVMEFHRPNAEAPDNFGSIVTPANVEEHLSRLRHDRDAYERANPSTEKIRRDIRAAIAARDAEE